MQTFDKAIIVLVGCKCSKAIKGQHSGKIDVYSNHTCNGILHTLFVEQNFPKYDAAKEIVKLLSLRILSLSRI